MRQLESTSSSLLVEGALALALRLLCQGNLMDSVLQQRVEHQTQSVKTDTAFVLPRLGTSLQPHQQIRAAILVAAGH